MKVRIESLAEGADRARGDVVIIDVFRAFTTAAVAFAGGAEQIIMVESVGEAMDLRTRGIGHLCMGEVGGRRPSDFDFGNSPHELSLADVSGRTIIQRTSAGTLGITRARSASQIFAGALVTASATARVIGERSQDQVTLVAMGLNAQERADEDEICAIHLRNLIEGRSGDAAAVRALILAGPRTEHFHDPARTHLHPQDLEIALDIDRFDFAIEVKRHEDGLTARPVRAPGAAAKPRC